MLMITATFRWVGWLLYGKHYKDLNVSLDSAHCYLKKHHFETHYCCTVIY